MNTQRRARNAVNLRTLRAGSAARSHRVPFNFLLCVVFVTASYSRGAEAARSLQTNKARSEVKRFADTSKYAARFEDDDFQLPEISEEVSRIPSIPESTVGVPNVDLHVGNDEEAPDDYGADELVDEEEGSSGGLFDETGTAPSMAPSAAPSTPPAST